MNTKILAAFLACLSFLPAGARAQSADFVEVRDGKFFIGDSVYYYTGANLWYGMNLGSEGEGGDRERLVRELDRLQALGLTNLRVMASSEGPATEPMRVHPAVQNEPGVYDETLLKGLDFLLAEMGKRDMKAVMVMNNFFMWSGGMAQYVKWVQGTNIPYPGMAQGGGSWDDFQRYSARFYTDERAQRLFLDYLDAVIHRENTITGTLYRDDPTIMAWQLANEPRGYGQNESYLRWVDSAAGFIQMMDPNHLVSLGGEGKISPWGGTEFERVSRSPNLDYLTMHLWVENWNWFEPELREETFDVAMGKGVGYLGDHVSIANEVGKPLVLEEYGMSRDGGAFGAEATTALRDRYYTILLEAILKLAQEGNVMAGSNVWSWSGEGLPRDPGQAWQDGDDFTGDPPHESQGWYSIYQGDTSTQSLLSHYAKAMREVGWGTAE